MGMYDGGLWAGYMSASQELIQSGLILSGFAIARRHTTPSGSLLAWNQMYLKLQHSQSVNEVDSQVGVVPRD